MNRALFSSLTPSHATPRGLYAELDAEFAFDLDPCPLNDAQIWDGKASLSADEIRFIRGRLKFGDAKNSAPFPSMVLVYRGSHTPTPEPRK